MNSENDPLVLVFSRNTFYRRLHFLALGALALNIIAIGILFWMLGYLLKNPSRPLYFATDDVSRLIRIVPVDVPNMSLENVEAWAIEAVEAAYSYDYINYRSQIQGAQKYFTSYGWRQYMNALSLSGNLRALTARDQIILAQVIDKPKVLAQGMLGGAYAWKFQMPLLVTYSMPPYDGSSQFSNALDITAIVQRQNALEGDKGLGLLQIISRMAETPAEQPQISVTPTS
jgi:intracellular multiplication protein IcmL